MLLQAPKIQFVDLDSQRKRIAESLEKAVVQVIRQGQYIMGPEVFELEKALSAYCGAKYTISCSSGTDALWMVLMALEVGPGDAVIVPTFTFAATAEVVSLVGATPIFVDVLPDTFNIDPKGVEIALTVAKKQGLKVKGIIPVDLFGQPADYDEIEAIAKREGIWVMSDAAQSFGAKYKNDYMGTRGIATATSFYPAKPLGCYGDGGAIFTDNEELAQRIVSIRVHGQGTHKYDNVKIGINGRMDTIQAAVLLQKLTIFKDELAARNRVAAYYNEALEGVAGVVPPGVKDGLTSTWAQYTMIIQAGRNRDDVANELKKLGVPTVVYYPRALHQQPAYAHYPVADINRTGKGALSCSEQLAASVLSLPMHAYLSEETLEYIVGAVEEVL